MAPTSVVKAVHPDDPKRYFLFEARDPAALGDPQAPVAGLLVWRVDERKGEEPNLIDPFNNDQDAWPGDPDSGWPDRHYRVAVMQADGAFDLERGQNRGDSGDLFRDLHDAQLRWHDGSPAGLPRIRNVEVGDGTISFDAEWTDD